MHPDRDRDITSHLYRVTPTPRFHRILPSSMKSAPTRLPLHKIVAHVRSSGRSWFTPSRARQLIATLAITGLVGGGFPLDTTNRILEYLAAHPAKRKGSGKLAVTGTPDSSRHPDQTKALETGQTLPSTSSPVTAEPPPPAVPQPPRIHFEPTVQTNVQLPAEYPTRIPVVIRPQTVTCPHCGLNFLPEEPNENT